MHQLFAALEICLLFVMGISGFIGKKVLGFKLTHALITLTVMALGISVFLPRDEWRYGGRVVIALAIGMFLQEILTKPRR